MARGGGGWQDLIPNISKNTWPPQVQLQNTMTPQKQMLENHSPLPPPPKSKIKRCKSEFSFFFSNVLFLELVKICKLIVPPRFNTTINSFLQFWSVLLHLFLLLTNYLFTFHSDSFVTKICLAAGPQFTSCNNSSSADWCQSRLSLLIRYKIERRNGRRENRSLLMSMAGTLFAVQTRN